MAEGLCSGSFCRAGGPTEGPWLILCTGRAEFLHVAEHRLLLLPPWGAQSWGGTLSKHRTPPMGRFAQHGAALGCPARSEPWSRGLRKSVGAGCALPRRAAIKATAFCRTRGGNVRPLPSHTKNFASNREARASPGTTRGLPSPAWEPLISAQLPRNRSSG